MASTGTISYDDIINHYSWREGADGSATLEDGDGNEFDPSFDYRDSALQEAIIKTPSRIWSVIQDSDSLSVAHGVYRNSALYYMIAQEEPLEAHRKGVFDADFCMED